MKFKTYNIPAIGDVLVCKHYSTRRLSIKLREGAPPKVVIPRMMNFDMGFRFAVEKQQWIKEHLVILEENSGSKDILDESKVVTTRFHKIQIQKYAGRNITSKKTNERFILFFPESEDLASVKNQKIIKSFVVEVLRKEAKEYFPARINELASRYGFSYAKVFIKNMKSRWGSCSSMNNINLNLHLMKLPEHLSDFIILHELCHTVHKNHGTAFHALLEKICGNEKLLNKELKKYRTQF
jgi:predicted metal-dependent hydrolase